MFEARLCSSGTFKKVLDAIKDLCNEVTFNCSESGITVQAMDNRHVSLVYVYLRSDGFDKYRCDRNLSMGMNLFNMAMILNCAHNNDTVTMKAQDNADTVTFMFESQNQEKVSDYEMKLMSLDQEYFRIPEIAYDCTVCMAASEFKRICEDLFQFGEYVVISCSSNECVSFSSASGTASIMLLEDEAVSIEIQDPVTLTLACQYLNSFTKATPLSAQVCLSLSNDMPLVVNYQIPDLGHIHYYLAPFE